MSAMIEAWVPVVWRECAPGLHGWTPDVPEDIPWRHAEIPSEVDPALPLRHEDGLKNPARHQGDPAVTYCRVMVPRSSLADVPKAIAAEDVPEEDRLLIELCRTPRQGIRMSASAARAFFAARKPYQGERRPMAGRLLVRAVRRGLSLPAARAIMEEHLLETE